MKENDVRELRDLLEQVLANQAVLYKVLDEIRNPNRSTPDAWLLEELNSEAMKFKTGSGNRSNT
jgi:hypothetical protein